MSVFEQLRPFVSLCQAHLTTWWFFLIFLLHVINTFLIWYMLKDVPNCLPLFRDLPITVKILLSVNSICYLTELILSRWIVSCYRKLRNAIEAIQEVEKLLGENFIAQHRSSVVTRFVIGFILVVLMAIGAVITTMPVYESMLPKNVDIILVTYVFFSGVLFYVFLFCTYFLFYMTYYVISHYAQLLLLHSNINQIPKTSLKVKQSLEIMRKNVLIFNYVCRASQELNNIFSVPVLILLTAKFISIVAVAFAFIYNKFIRSNVMLDNQSMTFLLTFLSDWIQVLILLVAADMPVDQVRLLRERVTAISSSGFSQSLAGKLSAMNTLVLIDEKRVCLSAAGLFKVGVHLIPALAGAVVTYMVILLES